MIIYPQWELDCNGANITVLLTWKKGLFNKKEFDFVLTRKKALVLGEALVQVSQEPTVPSY